MRKPKRLVVITLLTLLLTGCVSNKKNNLNSLEGLQSLGPTKISKEASGVNAIRIMALQETAMTLGAQSGLAARSKQVNAELQQNVMTMDRAFNFNQMMLPHNVLPPVLDQGDNSLNLADDNTLRLADRTYQIVSQARFVTVPPTWRDYLWMTYTDPEPPESALLPRNAKEREIWKQYVTAGWQKGFEQANSIYAENLSRLKRDYMGMILYRVLLASNMVSAPYVAHADLGITGGGSDMRINDQVLRITASPSLQANSKLWRPVLHP